MQKLQLQDLWRHRNPTIREFSCYTPAAISYSRLDYCLVSETLSTQIQSITYLALYISDHSPLQIHLKKGYKRPTVPTWRLQPEALTDAPFVNAVRDGLVQYFEANWGTSTTRGCDWEAMKVVIRGICMQTTNGVRHQLEKDVLDIEARLRDLEKCLPTQPQKMEDWRQASRVPPGDWRCLERYVHKSYRQRLHAEGDKAGASLQVCLNSMLTIHLLPH
ncbi:hypothetical protein NDU88_006022 [Pleurodeles waltl]|uniref:Uncharacterized protein n=1 Tax=Pleurodeles waltl TaxID=8319 RepID=A0AAV7QN11_PLEWA|nr:hypothetical protein NDU88_006022 [Pleurodeles waltl]